ncbi:MAG: LysE family translocator [Geminicoccaceae bacterium]
MEPFFVLICVFAIFLPALVLPGPDFVAVVRSSMARGTRSGLLTATGVSIGLSFYATLSLLGLSAILVEYQWLTWAVRVLGGGYLIYLGARLVMTKPREIDVDAERRAGQHHALIFGFLVTLTNPKAIVLFASVFATAVSPSTSAWLMVMMIALVAASSFCWYAFVAFFMSSGPILKRFRGAQHRIERAAGACFIGLGGKVLADARNPISP